VTSTLLALVVSSIQKKTSREVLNTIKTETAKQSTDGIKILEACITSVCLSDKVRMNLQTKHELMGVECQVGKLCFKVVAHKRFFK
jgi:hypothetical protein